MLILRLLIFMLLWCGISVLTLATQAKGGIVVPLEHVRGEIRESNELSDIPGSRQDTVKPKGDSIPRPRVDSAAKAADTTRPKPDTTGNQTDTTGHNSDTIVLKPPADTLQPKPPPPSVVADSLKTQPALIKPAPDSILSKLRLFHSNPDSMRRVMDSLRRLPTDSLGRPITTAKSSGIAADSAVKQAPDSLSKHIRDSLARGVADSLAKAMLDSASRFNAAGGMGASSGTTWSNRPPAGSSGTATTTQGGYQGQGNTSNSAYQTGGQQGQSGFAQQGKAGLPAGMGGMGASQGFNAGQGMNGASRSPLTGGGRGRLSGKAPMRAPTSNLRRKYLPVKPGKIQIDSLSLVPGTLMVKDLPDSFYTLDWVNSTITWNQLPPGRDSVFVVYRSFPYKLNGVTRHFNYDSIQHYFEMQPYIVTGSSGREQTADFFNFGNINYNGSFGRSISFGNTQDAVVTSNLNLQISGYLADSIEISAAITDNNIPIQPDGTTANLNEFDKIFLQFRKKNWALSMGDIDLRQNQNYFMNFYKRLQGASFETTTEISKGFTNRTLASAAIAKGKFTRNIFPGQEGNQGPYKLQGANNELYFIILAGTEKVFVDGQQMQRGQDQDYVINYNTAEITFTANRMITQDSRIQVEFEYADRNYLNVNLYLYDEAMIDKKLKLRMGYFSNSDARNSPINQSLTPDQEKFLNRLGDSITHAFYPVANVDTFAVGKILYKKIDTTYKNASGAVVHDSIYVFSVDQTATLFNLSFTNVGQGYGNYIPDLNGVNGNVYIWVAPVNGQMQGSYEAAQFLVTPKTQRVMTVGADYAVSKNTAVVVDLARSHYDVNTLSNIDKSNDDGYAARFQVKNLQHIGDPARDRQLISTLGYEYVQSTFQPLERLRSPEFTRDWGLALTVNPADERIYTGSFLLSDKKSNTLRYDVGRYQRGDGFTGLRNILAARQDLMGWMINGQLSYTTSDSGLFKGYYFRPTLDISRKLLKMKGYVIGATYSVEHNEERDKGADTVSLTSYAFQTMSAYFKSPDKDRNKWGISYTTRVNSYPDGPQLVEGDRSKNLNFFLELMRNPHHMLRFNATYRNLKIVNTKITTQTADNTLLGRAEYLINEWKGMVKGNVLYEVGSGQEQKQSYTYLQVPAGTGQYTWVDYNKDGIQQLNEFVLAQFQDQAQYIRVYTPTDEYIKASYSTLNYSLNFNPRLLIDPRKSHGFHKLLTRMILQSTMQLTQKQQAQGFIKFNPFKAPLDDTSLISRAMIMVNTLSFNRSDPAWGFDLSNTRNGGKVLLTYGYETRQTNEWTLRTRLNITRAIIVNAALSKGANSLSNSSSNFDSSNYNLQTYSIAPDLSYTKGSNFRVGVGYKLSYKENTPGLGGQHYSAGSFNTDIKYNMLQSASVQAKFTMSTISYIANGAPASTTSAVSYTILEGLLPGKNYLWSIDFTKKLGSSLELSIQYEGRKPAGTNTINTGRAALRALL